ncbi:MAG TPA: hypothetical protein VJH22_05310 [Candidatus Nanoarchaeia archaeon]|nr:hypothetical protein [Candidatus Nanoarchaeia archaeon]
MTTHSCIRCNVPLLTGHSAYKGLTFDALVCPKCGKKIFTQEQATQVIDKLEAQRLQQQYQRKIIKIGNSWGFTFPKDIVEVFQLTPKTPLRIQTDLKHNKIEISFG